MNHVIRGRRLQRLQRAAVMSTACLALQLLVAGMPGDGFAVAATPAEGELTGYGDGMAVDATPTVDLDVAPADPMTASIDSLVEKELGVYGVVLMRPDGGVLYNRNGDTPFVSASLYKLILLADICHAIDAGLISPDTPLFIESQFFDDLDGYDSYFDPTYAGSTTTVQEAMFAAGAFSSNVAAKALLSVTSPADLNATAADLGLTGTFLFMDPRSTPRWPPVADADTTSDDAVKATRVVLSYASDGHVNLTTPMDMARFFMLLMNDGVYNERVSAMVTAILQQQTINDRFPALLPPETQFVHKTGNLENVVHDVGVIFAPSGPVILAAMVEATSNDERATQVVQRLALIAYGVYDVPPLTAPEFPDGTPENLDGTAPDRSNSTPAEATPGARTEETVEASDGDSA